MQTYISLLRGINVASQNKIEMKTLSKLYESLNLKNVKTYIQSGNVVFQSDKSANVLENEVMKAIKDKLKLDIKVIIRDVKELKKVIDDCPFKDNERLYVTFLSEQIKDIPIGEINKAKSKDEEFIISNKEVYLSFPLGYGRTKLSNAFFEKKLKVIATTRNWNTVNTLFEMTPKG